MAPRRGAEGKNASRRHPCVAAALSCNAVLAVLVNSYEEARALARGLAREIARSIFRQRRVCTRRFTRATNRFVAPRYLAKRR